MLDVVTTSFYIKSADFSRRDFENFSTELFDEWEKDVKSHLYLPDYSLTLIVEEGSIKGGEKIAASAAALYFAIGNYGDFISGLQTIQQQASYVADTLFDQAKQSFGCSSARGNSKKNGGEVFYLKRLFERVQSGHMSPDEAMSEVRNRWGDEAASSPKFLTELASNLADAPRYPEQLTLSDESWESCFGGDIQEREPRPRVPHEPHIPIPQHYRIEISRPSKGDKKKVKLTKVM
jgi:hypothetical protein